MSDIGESRFLPELMAALRERAPAVRVETRPVPRAQIAEALDSGQIDFAFGFLPSPPDWFVQQQIALHTGGRVRVSAAPGSRFQTTNPKVFAGGDMVRGADLVVTAVFEGREAAKGILNYLGVS